MIEGELKAMVGPEHVLKAQEVLEEYAQDLSLAPPANPSLVVRPESTEEVQHIVKSANKYSVPLIPCSSGVHFYGCTVPADGGIVVDLRRMDRILKVDGRNRAIRIEPGVTWGKAQEEANSYGLRALNPLLSHTSKSALSSSLEREPMLIPKAEYGEPVLTMEIVLPSGEIFRTGSASVGSPEEIQTDLVGPSGPGLDFYRLFQGAQGTMGIVTWVNLKSPPLPKLEKFFFVPLSSIEEAVKPIGAIQRRMLGAECFVLNGSDLASVLAERLPEDLTTLKENLPPWLLIQCLAGGERLPQEKVDYEQEDLLEVCENFHIEPTTALPGLPDLGRVISNMARSPWQKEPYWKQRFKGRFFDIFFYTKTSRVPEFTRAVFEQASTRGYPKGDIGCYVQPLDRARACYVEFTFPYSEQDREEKEGIDRLYNELSTLLMGMGAFFGRPYGVWSNLVYRGNAPLTSTLKKLKRVLDPNNIMNPGRLCF
jgi:FAD/FMN-containing dehydrogenase